MKRPYRNPFTSRDEEILRLKAEIEQLRLQPTLKAFAADLGTACATVLATMPFEQWPEIGKAAFRHCQGNAPTAAYFYRQNLLK